MGKTCPSCGQKLKMGLFKKLLIGVAALIVISVISSMGEDDSTQTASTTPKSGESKEEAKKETKKEEKPLANEGVSSDVIIKVGAVESLTEVGNEYTKETAQGVFKIVEVSLTNNQKDAITVDANNFKLVDDQGREFTYSSDAQISFDMENSGDMEFFLKSLNPGLTLTGKIVFDIPTDAKGVVLHAKGGMMV